MQLALILGIAFALLSVLFALQNNVPVTVTLLLWRFDSSLAVVLLIALALGALVAALVSSPAMIRGSWTNARQKRQIAELESEHAQKTRQIGELESEVSRLTPPSPTEVAEPKPYVGLKALITGGKGEDKGA